jgi:hypothetical protein
LRKVSSEGINHILLRVRVRKIKNIAVRAANPITDKKTAMIKPRFLRVRIKVPSTARRAKRAKRTEKGT